MEEIATDSAETPTEVWLPCMSGCMCILKYMPHHISRVESLSYVVKVARPIMHSVCGVAL